MKFVTFMIVTGFDDPLGLTEVSFPALEETGQLNVSNLEVRNTALKSFEAPKLHTVWYGLYIDNNDVLVQINFDDLRHVGTKSAKGVLTIRYNPFLEHADFPALEGIYGSSSPSTGNYGLVVYGNHSLSRISIPGGNGPVTIGGNIDISNNFSREDRPAHFALEGVESAYNVFGNFTTSANAPVYLDMGGLKEVKQEISLRGFTDINLGDTQVGGRLIIQDNGSSKLSNITTGKLVITTDFEIFTGNSSINVATSVNSVGGNLGFHGRYRNTATEAITLPELTSVGGNLHISHFTRRLDLPVLQSVGLDIDFSTDRIERLTSSIRSLRGALRISGPFSNLPAGEFDLSNLERIGGDLVISQVNNLENLNFLSALRSVGDIDNVIHVIFNRNLDDCCLLACNFTLNGQPLTESSPYLVISDNSGNCNTAPEVFANCASPDATFTRAASNRRNTFTASNPTAASYRWTSSIQGSGYDGPVFSTGLWPDYGKIVVCLTVVSEGGCSTTHCETYGIDLPGPDDEGSGGGVAVEGASTDGGSDDKPKDSANPGKSNYLSKSLSPLITTVTAFPNPFTTNLRLNITTQTPLQLELYNAAGTRVQQQSLPGAQGQRTISFATAHLPAGMYIMRGVNESGEVVISQKVVKR